MNEDKTIENKQGSKDASIEEMAFEEGHINKDQVLSLAQPFKKTNMANISSVAQIKILYKRELSPLKYYTTIRILK